MKTIVICNALILWLILGAYVAFKLKMDQITLFRLLLYFLCPLSFLISFLKCPSNDIVYVKAKYKTQWRGLIDVKLSVILDKP